MVIDFSGFVGVKEVKGLSDFCFLLLRDGGSDLQRSSMSSVL